MDTVPAKTILTRNKDTSWFGSDYNMNLYRGCSHGCIYCDSRSTCYHVEDFDRVLKCGADKVSVNSGALRDPGLIPAAAQKYGDQCVVLSADVKRVNGQFRVFAKGGREDTGRNALDWISWCVAHGAGEICLNSIDTDGVRTGFDLEMLDAVAARVNVPIIASGGAGKKEDFLELFHHKGIDAGLAAGIFHQKLLAIHDLKTYLNENGVEMRL